MGDEVYGEPPSSAETAAMAALLALAVDKWLRNRARRTTVENAREDPAEPMIRWNVESDACEFCKKRGSFLAKPGDTVAESHRGCKCHPDAVFAVHDGVRKQNEKNELMLTFGGSGKKPPVPPIKKTTGLPEKPKGNEGRNGSRKRPKHYDKWQEVDIESTMGSFADDWEKAEQAGPSKTRYQSKKTPLEFVVDNELDYFRIIDSKVDKRRFWDCVLPDGTHLERGTISKSDYQRMTHFRIKGVRYDR